MMRTPRTRTSRRLVGRGFTLAEVLVCASLLAIGFVALVGAFGQETRSVARGEQMTLAISLADEVRDGALQMAFADIKALGGTTYSPAHLSTGASANLADWKQTIVATPVLVTSLNQTDASASPKAVMLTVTVSYQNNAVLTQSYYFFDPSSVLFTDGKTRT